MRDPLPKTLTLFMKEKNRYPIYYRKGLGTRLQIMGSATIDPNSHKVQTNLDPIESKIQPFENVKLYKEMMAIRTIL